MERGEGWGGEEALRNGGRAGRETFDRFVDCKERKLPRNEGVWVGGGEGGAEGAARAGGRRGAEEEVRLGLWVLLGGVSIELEGRDGRTQEGVTPYRARLRAPCPLLSLSWRKEGSPGPPPRLSQPAFRGGRCGGETRQQGNLSMVCAPALRRGSERAEGADERIEGQTLQRASRIRGFLPRVAPPA